MFDWGIRSYFFAKIAINLQCISTEHNLFFQLLGNPYKICHTKLFGSFA